MLGKLTPSKVRGRVPSNAQLPQLTMARRRGNPEVGQVDQDMDIEEFAEEIEQVDDKRAFLQKTKSSTSLPPINSNPIDKKRPTNYVRRPAAAAIPQVEKVNHEDDMELEDTPPALPVTRRGGRGRKPASVVASQVTKRSELVVAADEIKPPVVAEKKTTRKAVAAQKTNPEPEIEILPARRGRKRVERAMEPEVQEDLPSKRQSKKRQPSSGPVDVVEPDGPAKSNAKSKVGETKSASAQKSAASNKKGETQVDSKAVSLEKMKQIWTEAFQQVKAFELKIQQNPRGGAKGHEVVYHEILRSLQAVGGESDETLEQRLASAFFKDGKVGSAPPKLADMRNLLHQLCEQLFYRTLPGATFEQYIVRPITVRFGKLLAIGGQGAVLEAQYQAGNTTPVDVVAKVHYHGGNTHVPSVLLKEARIYEALAKFPDFFAHMISQIDFDDFSVLLLERLGPTVHTMRQLHSRGERLEWSTVASVGLRALEALRVLHEAGWAHSDVSLGNLLVSPDYKHDQQAKLYLVDFGTAVNLKGYAIPYEGFVGTRLFAPRASFRNELSQPVDDLESLGYCLWHLAMNELPWSWDVSVAAGDPSAMDRIYTKKIGVFEEPSKANIPEPLRAYFSILTSHGPDYAALRNALQSSTASPTSSLSATATKTIKKTARAPKTSADRSDASKNFHPHFEWQLN